eukprot:46241-Hanusia_phi.AAC.1
MRPRPIPPGRRAVRLGPGARPGDTLSTVSAGAMPRGGLLRGRRMGRWVGIGYRTAALGLCSQSLVHGCESFRTRLNSPGCQCPGPGPAKLGITCLDP